MKNSIAYFFISIFLFFLIGSNFSANNSNDAVSTTSIHSKHHLRQGGKTTNEIKNSTNLNSFDDYDEILQIPDVQQNLVLLATVSGIVFLFLLLHEKRQKFTQSVVSPNLHTARTFILIRSLRI